MSSSNYGLGELLLAALNKNLTSQAKKHSFVVGLATNGEYYWTYYDGNYRKVATSGETFKRREAAENAIQNVITEIKTHF